MKLRILSEGGNIFKDEDGTPVTQRINQADVDPTLAWVEAITGIPHKDFKLGSTGIRSTSGDMDIAVNQNEVDKADLYNTLAAWAQKNHPEEMSDSGLLSQALVFILKLLLTAIPIRGMYKQI